jgi:hypothetical protein
MYSKIISELHRVLSAEINDMARGELGRVSEVL